MEDCMLTTYDNTFNPFTEFESWWKEDIRLGHDTCGLLARIACVSDVASEEIREKDTTDAMKTIVKRWPTIFKIVTVQSFPQAAQL